LVGLLIPLAILLTPEFAASGRWLLVSSLMVIARSPHQPYERRDRRDHVNVMGRPTTPTGWSVAMHAGIVAAGVLGGLPCSFAGNFPVFTPAHHRTKQA